MKFLIYIFLLVSYTLYPYNISIYEKKPLHHPEKMKIELKNRGHNIKFYKHNKDIKEDILKKHIKNGEKIFLFDIKKGVLILNIYSDNIKYPSYILTEKLTLNIFKKLLIKGISLLNLENLNSLTIFEAILQNDLKSVKTFIQRGDLTLKDIDGNTPLLYALLQNRVEIYRYLIEEGNSSIVTLNRYNISPLALLIKYKEFKYIKNYLKTPFTNYKTKNKKTLLHYAIQSGDKELINKLKSLGLSEKDITLDKKTSLHFAALSGDVELFKEYIKKGFKFDQKSSKGVNILHFAAKSGDIELVKYILENYKSLNLKTEDKYGRTPLFYGVLSNSIDMVNFLIDSGSDIYKLSKFKRNILDYAIKNRKLKVVKHLLKWDKLLKDGENIRKKTIFLAFQYLPLKNLNNILKLVPSWKTLSDKYGKNPLHYSILGGNFSTVKYILKDRKFFDSKTSSGEGGLYFSLLTSRKRLFLYLYYKGFTPKRYYEYGENILHIAVQSKDLWFFNFLKKHHKELFLKNKNGETLLHMAIRGGNLKLVKDLLPYYKNLNLFDRYLNTPLNHAITGRFYKIFDLLLKERVRLDIANYFRKCPLDIAEEMKDQYFINKLEIFGAPKCYDKFMKNNPNWKPFKDKAKNNDKTKDKN